MAKAVVYVLTATAILCFLFRSPANYHEHKGRIQNRRFGLIRERVAAFDPLVTKIEREAEKNGLGGGSADPANLTFVSEASDTYQYLTAGGKLNTTLRLRLLFPLLDREPIDRVVSFKELEAWITQQAVERLDYITEKELESKDENGDLSISFREYLPHFSEKDIEKKGMGHGEAGWWHQRFTVADMDGNGFLSFNEFRDFLHPEDSKNVEMLKWLLRDRLKRMDVENDGKLNFKEFKDRVYKTYQTYKDFETAGGPVPSADQTFAELDVNKDQFLSAEELVPIIHYLYPGELSFAKYYTIYLMNEADDNEDGALSLQEMLNHEFIFYTTLHEGDHEADNDEL